MKRKIENTSSSELEEEDHRSCLVHFVDKDIFDHIYLASGALLHATLVLTTRDFLEPYKQNVIDGNLFVYHESWKTNDQSSKVKHVYTDRVNNSQLAAAKVNSLI